jgi:lysophospholipase L1-like esterase
VPVQVRFLIVEKAAPFRSVVPYNQNCAEQSELRGKAAFDPRIDGDSLVKRITLRVAFAVIVLVNLYSAAALRAQTPAAAPEAKAPLAAPEVPPVSDAQKAREERLKVDFPWLARFKEADLALRPPSAGENRVVFMGDSITQAWQIEGPEGSFPGKPYINRGISGQTTPQMVLRFRQDVIALKPKVVVILAGINDIAGNTGPETLEQIEDNLASMADLATANQIRVVLCSTLPAFNISWHPGVTPAPKVLALNEWIKAYTAQKGYVYVDYHTPRKDQRDGLPPSLSKDGVHPTPDGYAVMAPLVEAGIEKALKAGNSK